MKQLNNKTIATEDFTDFLESFGMIKESNILNNNSSGYKNKKGLTIPIKKDEPEIPPSFVKINLKRLGKKIEDFYEWLKNKEQKKAS
ncbi:hypothetical protein [Myroides marinus]|uniref:hypothetical protein n=1 Tax=Myroides marinus TaxID=703342 RepID=UPI0025749C39|nr:hypothetical protein [Myroides marinus]MDM1345729.1 hypothetical protein [Myroides marinus]MDM1378791.1 hypothetical protein [Myroides marinus]MDM1386062.1 hypothetical protein [Myroides marinus]MDM1393275.1 hypothetical protein [Myroides marinus]